MLFTRLSKEYLSESRGRFICPGIHVYDNFEWAAQVLETRTLGCRGFSLFSYQSLFPGHKPSGLVGKVCNSLFAEAAPLPEMVWKKTRKDVSGPVIGDLTTLPAHVREGTPFRIMCRITDPSGVYDDNTGSEGQGVYLAWSYADEVAAGNEVRMTPVKDSEDWFVTTEKIVGQPAGTELLVRVFAWDGAGTQNRAGTTQRVDAKDRNLGYSDILSLVVDFAEDRYHSQGTFGPLIWNATDIAADSSGKLWITSENNGGARILDEDGVELPFSPVRMAFDDRNGALQLMNLSAVAIDREGIVHLCAADKPELILRLRAVNGDPLPAVRANFPVGDIDFDGRGNAFVLEANTTRWRVFDRRWRELTVHPYGQLHVGNGIAVSPDGSDVYIASASENAVQRWCGAVSGGYVRYWPVGFLPVRGIGEGKVGTDGFGNIYVAHMPGGRVSVLNSFHQLYGFLRGGTPPLRAPQGVSICPTGRIVYVLEKAEGPCRISKWLKILD
jgi:hypothetical protein